MEYTTIFQPLLSTLMGKNILEDIGEKVTIPNYAVEASLAARLVIEAKYGLGKRSLV